MSENKEYWTSSVNQGEVKISDEVICSIAALAVCDVEGVHSLSSGIGTDIAEFFGKKIASKGVKARFNESTVDIDVFVLVKFGTSICEIAENAQKRIASSVESMTGLHVGNVNVNVTGIVFENEPVQTVASEG